MRFFLAAGLALASFISDARADYVGCLSGVNSFTVAGSPYVARTGVTSELGCQSACSTFKYSFYQPNPNGGRVSCYCAPAGTDFRARIVTSSAPPDGTPNSTPRQCLTAQTSYRITMLATTFVFEGCYLQSGFAGAAVQRTDITTNDGCATTCRFFTFMAFLASPTGNNPICYCSNAQIFTSAAGACSNMRPIQHQHTPMQASAGMERRRAQKRQAEQARLAAQPCPGKLVACRTHREEEDEYECLDTSSELESCGGCVNGYYRGANTTSLAGEDCSNLAGVSLGGVTCAAGQCKVFTCRRGYTLVDGRCEVTRK